MKSEWFIQLAEFADTFCVLAKSVHTKHLKYLFFASTFIFLDDFLVISDIDVLKQNEKKVRPVWGSFFYFIWNTGKKKN